ncbi:SAM-dependent methyltransferase, partial [Enterococcus hirae]
RPAPFMEPAPAWAQACPELSSWLEALTDEDCDYYEPHLIEFAGRIRDWLPGRVGYEQRIAVPVLSPSPATPAETTLPEVAATDMPGR